MSDDGGGGGEGWGGGAVSGSGGFIWRSFLSLVSLAHGWRLHPAAAASLLRVPCLFSPPVSCTWQDLFIHISGGYCCSHPREAMKFRLALRFQPDSIKGSVCLRAGGRVTQTNKQQDKQPPSRHLTCRPHMTTGTQNEKH